ncbi:MAG: hypothetical protein NDJ90_05875, partial [Oligoflexia bacterium]|nr:hypothetical protein [Oligoflexia bacterium]
MSIDGKRPDRVACLLAPASLPAKTLAALGEACLRFTPVVALREGEAVFLDITACGKLYSEERLRARLLALGRRFVPGAGACRVAIARDAATALALARFGLGGEDSAEAWRRLPLLALRDFASPFAGGGQEREAVKNVERILGLLAALGVRTLGDVAALPPASLAQRLGKDSVELSARLRGELGRAWPGFHPEPQLIERAEENAENVEAILFALKGPLDRAMARLRGRAQRALALEV